MIRAEDAAIERVRSFNRAVTQRVGALQDHYLARNRSLGESRVLWEIGEGGCDVRALRARLGLDSGYLSRLLRSLEDGGLVRVLPSATDRRVRTATLTRKGRNERARLDRRSDEVARSMLDPLSGTERERLIEAMREVERLLAVADLRIDTVDPTDPAAQLCLREYFAELDRRFSTGFDPARTTLPDPAEMRPPSGEFLVATLHGRPVGCGGLKFHDAEPTEIKRMWISSEVRGLGLGRRMLHALEDRARTHGDTVVRLDTNAALPEAIALYRSSGYHDIPRFNDDPYPTHFFEKRVKDR